MVSSVSIKLFSFSENKFIRAPPLSWRLVRGEKDEKSREE